MKAPTVQVDRSTKKKHLDSLGSMYEQMLLNPDDAGLKNAYLGEKDYFTRAWPDTKPPVQTQAEVTDEALQQNWKRQVDNLQQQTYDRPHDVGLQKAYRAELGLYMESYPDEVPSHLGGSPETPDGKAADEPEIIG